MSTNKKFRIQNGADIVGELSINDVTVIGADGKVVAGAIADAVADLTASDIADLQSQVTAILGTSPETLDTLQEIVNAFQDADTNLVADVASNTSDIATINTTLTSGVATTAQGAKADTAVQPEDFFTVADGSTTSYLPDYTSYISSTSLSTSSASSHANWNHARLIKDMSHSENGNVIAVYGSMRNETANGSYLPGQTSSGGTYQLLNHWVVVWDNQGNYIHSYDMGIVNDTSTFGTINDDRTHYSADVTDTHIFIGTHYGNIPGAATGSQYAVFEISNPTVAIAQGSAGLNSAGQTKIRVIGEKLITSSQGNQLHEGNFSVKEWMTGNNLSSPIALGQTNNWDTDKESGWLYSSPRGGSITGYNFKTNQSAPIISGIQGYYGQVSVGNKYVVVSDNEYNVDRDVRVFDVGTSNEVTSISNPGNTHHWGGGVYTEHKMSTISTHGDAVVICAYNQSPRTRTHYLYDMSSATPNQHVNSFSGANIDGARQVVELTGNNTIVKTMHTPTQRWGTVLPTIDYMSIAVSTVITPNVDASTIASKVYVDNAVANADNTTEMTTAIATAKSEAISTASADATAKADAAESDAKAYADQVVAATVDAAPAALDTLNELAAALGDDANFASTVTASIATKASQVDHDAEVARATAAEVANAAAIAAANSRTSGISTSSGSTDIQMTAELDMDSNNIKNANDVYAARGFIDTIESNDLKVQTGTVDFEGSIVNFGSSQIIGSGFGTATKAEVDAHLNIPTANAGEFVKWTGTDYEWTDLVSGRLATDQLQVASGGSIAITGPGGTFDFQDGIVMLSGSDVRVDTPTDVGQAANKGYVDGVVAATVDAAPAALDTLNELAAALGDDANFSATVATSIGTKASQTDHDAEVAARIAGDSAEASARSSADAALQAEIDALEVLQSGDQSNLQSQITAEVARATSAEAVNAANIVSETSARSSADAALESDIIGLQNQVGTIIAGSPASLDTLVEIVSAFENADSDLSGVITANGGRLTTAENNITALETDLSAEESARGAGDAALQANIDAEAATRSGLGSQLLGYININGAAIIAGDNANSAEVATEKSRAEGAEATLQSNIDALTSSTGVDVSGLQANIDAEASTRSSADSALQSSIDAEESRATSAEAGLQSQISNVLSNTDATALNSLAEIVAEFQSADSTLTGAVAGHGTRLTSLESSTSAILAWDTDNVSEGSTNKYWTPERTKTALSGGLCITYNSSTGEIKIDEAETAAALHVASSTDANGLGGQAPSHYRIDVYDVNGTVVN